MAVDGEYDGKITPTDTRVKRHDAIQAIINKDYFFLNTSSPHKVKTVNDAFQTDVFEKGKNIRYSATCNRESTRMNFITPRPRHFRVATNERGIKVCSREIELES